MGAETSYMLDEARNNPKLQRGMYDRAVDNKDKQWCFIACRWLNQWMAYTDGSSKQRPGPIDNSELFVFGSVLQSDMHRRKDYYCINPRRWNMLYTWYGGGPRIVRQRGCIYAPPNSLMPQYRSWSTRMKNKGHRLSDILEAIKTNFKAQYAYMAETGIERPLEIPTEECVETTIATRIARDNVESYEDALFYIAYLTDEQMDEWFEQNPSIEFIKYVTDAERPLSDLMLQWMEGHGYKPFWKWMLSMVKKTASWAHLVSTYEPHLFDDYVLREAVRVGNAVAVECLLQDPRVDGNNDKAWQIALAMQNESITALLNDWSPQQPTESVPDESLPVYEE